MILTKTIKPSRLKEDALRLELLNAIRDVGRKVKKDFEATVKTWEHKPEFEMLISLIGGPTVLVATDDEIYRYVDEGTKPHPIFAGVYTGKSDKKVLAFPSIFKPKTTPNVIGSGPGFKGGDTVLRPYVNHPGTKPRNFSKIIKKKWDKPYKRRMEQAMKDVARKSGHGL